MFADVKPLVRLARRKVLQPADLPALPKRLSPRNPLIPDSAVNAATARTLIGSLWRAGRAMLVPALVLNVSSTLLSLTKPVLIHAFVAQLAMDLSQSSAFGFALVLAFALGAVSFVASMATQHYYFLTLGLNQVFTNTLNRLLYRQSLLLTQRSRSESQLGDVVNHMSSDSDSVAESAQNLGDALVSLLTIVGAAGLLFYYLGSTAVVAVALLALMVPLSRKVARSFSTLDESSFASATGG